MKLAYIVLCVFLLPYCLKAESADSLRLMRTKELKAVFDSLGVADPVYLQKTIFRWGMCGFRNYCGALLLSIRLIYALRPRRILWSPVILAGPG